MTKFSYIGCFFDEANPLSNREVCDKLNEQYEKIEILEDLNNELKQKIIELEDDVKSIESKDDYIDYLEKQNERLKERIIELTSNDKIVFING